MGGYGSGQHFRSKYYRFTVEDCFKFELCRYQIRRVINLPDREKYFSVLTYYKNNEAFFRAKVIFIDNTTLVIASQYGISEIKLIYQSTGVHRNDGKRLMVCCPNCGKKKIKLFLKPPYYYKWLCRNCHNLTYESCKESSPPDRIERFLATTSGASVKFVRKSLNRLKYHRYKDNYTIETLFNEDTIMKQTGIKLSSFELKELEKLSKELDLSRSEIIRRALDYYIDFLRMQKSKTQTAQDNK